MAEKEKRLYLITTFFFFGLIPTSEHQQSTNTTSIAMPDIEMANSAPAAAGSKAERL
jgi:hypothetical protein